MIRSSSLIFLKLLGKPLEGTSIGPVLCSRPNVYNLFKFSNLTGQIEIFSAESILVHKFLHPDPNKSDQRNVKISIGSYVEVFTASVKYWIDEIPLDKDPQRFGNKSFRIWGNRLEREAKRLHNDLIDSYHLVIQPELLFYFRNYSGSFSRLDYGTGHEASFLAYLLILHLTRVLKNKDILSLVLVIYKQYLDICRKLQDYYRLEPAGSKGVYGLDDHFHLVYVFGSAQLLNVQTINPSQIIDKKFLETPNLSESSLFFGAIKALPSQKEPSP
ncbi:hypothetical protein PPACK8108_LOCUS8952 [Phakopsora pachyrhizi]|uniref:Serine/threonine-protein phosphatase 2A activator n=1 Tax=Phakopsora pachyrhizi TaxID=170000 RepID=A0AAV0AY24_PHAPC|nr:hypothetical protein PPACK8108_LOCUS8952 [Phakopsora pachyrhizi]